MEMFVPLSYFARTELSDPEDSWGRQVTCFALDITGATQVAWAGIRIILRPHDFMAQFFNGHDPEPDIARVFMMSIPAVLPPPEHLADDRSFASLCSRWSIDPYFLSKLILWKIRDLQLKWARKVLPWCHQSTIPRPLSLHDWCL